MKLSFIMSGVRVENWMKVYKSISNATTIKDYELVIVSPYDLPRKVKRHSNVILIKDKGSPTRCHQLALLKMRGEYVVWVGEDGVFCPTMAIDKAIASIPENKGVVALPFLEGNRVGMKNPSWWRMDYHKMFANIPSIPNHYLITMMGLMRRDYLMDIGGWDCRFEHSGLSHVDLAIRLQNDGANVVLGEQLMELDMLKGNDGDHGPIAEAHRIDKGLFKQIYSIEGRESRVNINNWEASPSEWRRFK